MLASSGTRFTPLPPAMIGAVAGQPYRKRLKPDDDPFGAVGDYVGSFLVKGAVDHGARSGFARLTGSWPGEQRPDRA